MIWGNTGSLSVSEQRQRRASWILVGRDVVWMDTHSESSVSAKVWRRESAMHDQLEGVAGLEL